MEAFDAAVAWWDTAISITSLGSFAAASLCFVWVALVLGRTHRAVLVALPIAIVAWMLTTFLITQDAKDEVQAACATLPMDVEGRAIRLSSLDESNIGTHCGAAILRVIVNQAGAA